MPQLWPKWSWWLLKERQAVGFSMLVTGISSSNFSVWSRWLFAIILPARPKKGSLATSTSQGSSSDLDDRLPALHPAPLEGLHLLRRADADVFALAEELHARRVLRGLVAEAVGGQLVEQPLRRHRSLPGDRRIERIAGGRRHGDLGRLLHRGPVLALRHQAEKLGVVALVAHEGMDAAGKLREALHVAGLLQRRPRHAGRKMDARRPVRPADASTILSKRSITSSKAPERP